MISKTALAFFITCLPLLAGCGTPEQKEARYLRSGNALFEKGEYEKARVEYKNAARIKPEDAEPIYRIGLVDEAEGYLHNAFSNFIAAEEQDKLFVPTKLKIAQYLMTGDQIPAARERIVAVLSEAPENAEAHALWASLLIRDNKLDEAETEASFALRLDPANMSGAAALTGAYAADQRFDNALAAVNTGLDHHPGNIPLLILKIMVYAHMDDLPDIAKTYAEIFKLKPDEPQYRADLAGLYVKAGNIDAAETVWRDTVAARPDDWNMKHELVSFLGKHRGVEAAEKEIHDLITAYPGHDAPYFWLADIYIDHDQTAKAIDILTPVAEHGSSPVSALNARAALARIYSQRGDNQRAESLVNEVLAKAPDNLQALLVRADLEYNAGNYPAAVIDLRNILHADPDWKEALRLLAETLLRQKRYDLAIDTLKRLADVAPSDIKARIRLAQMMQLNGEGKKAVTLITQVIKQAPENPVAWESAARLAIDNHEWLLADQAIVALDKIDGQQALASFLRGQIQHLNGKDDDAIATFTAIADAGPTTALGERSMKSLAAIYGTTGRMETACGYFESLKTDDALVNSLLGECYAATGKPDEAASAFDKAITAKASFQDPYLGRARLYAADGKPDVAVEILKQAGIAAPGDERAPMMQADLLAASGHYRDAMSIYDLLLAHDPDNEKIANNLAEMIADYGSNDAEALEHARNIAERFTGSADPVLLDTLAWVYFRGGNLPMAENTIERAMTAHGANPTPQMHYHDAAILMKAGEAEKARAELQAATAEGASYPGFDDAKAMLASP